MLFLLPANHDSLSGGVAVHNMIYMYQMATTHECDRIAYMYIEKGAYKNTCEYKHNLRKFR